MNVKTVSEELMAITGCPREDVARVEFLMREKSPILGELDRRKFNKLARDSYEVLKFIRSDNDPESKWLLGYVNKEAR